MPRRLGGAIFQNKNQLWSLYAQLVRLLGGFAFIFVLARALPSTLLGTWYLFVSIFGVSTLVEMGLSQVIGRHVAYLKADYVLGRVGGADFVRFARAGERLYLGLAAVVGGIAFPAGLWKLAQQQDGAHLARIALPWLVYVAGGGITLLAAYYAALVNGAGEMWQSQRAAISAAAVNVATLCLLFLFPETLLVPAGGLLLSQLFLLAMLRRAFWRLEVVRDRECRGISAQLPAGGVLRTIARDAAKMCVGMVAYQLMTNGFLLVLSGYLGHAWIGSYGLTVQLVGVVSALSMIWSQSNFYDMAETRQTGDLGGLRRIFFGGLARSCAASFAGLAAVFFLGMPVLQAAGSRTLLLPSPVLSVVLASAWLEFALSQFAQLLIAKGEMQVVYVSLGASLAICGASVILLSGGYSLGAVFAARIVTFAFLYGVPVLVMAGRLLKWGASASEVAHETA